MRANVVLWAPLALGMLCLPAPGAPRVFPEPREMSASGAGFTADAGTVILLPPGARDADAHLARLLSEEFSERHDLGLKQQVSTRLPGSRYLLAGSVANPLVKEWCAAHGQDVTASNPGPEGYLMSVTPDAVVIAGSDDAGAFYGVQSLRQLISGSGTPSIPGVKIRDWPYMKFRGVKLYLPGRGNLPYFRRFLRDYMALYKYNKLIVEMNAAMHLDRHPELNAGWIDFARDLFFRRLNEPPGLWFHGNNSTHHDTADGGVLEKSEVADMVRWAEESHIEVIPELPTLTHSYYLLAHHRELAEIPQEEYPDTYCPSLPAVYDLVFDVYDEFIEVMKPKMVQIGHDEWRMPWGVCPRCRNKDPRELYAQDVNKIYDYLKRKGIRTAMWSDHLLENVRGVRTKKPWWNNHQYTYQIPGSLSPEQVKQWIPKDILMFNWLWGYTDDPKFPPITNEQRLSEWGFESVYGNFEDSIPNFAARTGANPKIVGGAPSAWLATTEFNFGKDRIADFTGCAGLVWSGRDRTAAERSETMAAIMPAIRRNLSGEEPPSGTDPVLPLKIAASFTGDIPGMTTRWKPGRVSRGRLVFELSDAGGKSAVVAETSSTQNPPPVRIGQDVSSLIFLHALAKPAQSVQGYDEIWDFADSADLLGWYEIEYQDGLVVTVPLRYGWNIADWQNLRGRVPYQADAVQAGPGIKLYAFEWTNQRLGKVIKEVRLKGSKGFVNAAGKVIPPNAVALAGISTVPKRVKPKQPDPPFPQ